ncbi:Permease protein [uncultured Pleomorphomonas sp.]|uniref:Probable membrane transporter protein n=2 Tax=Pleomorphomonas TaxID=261933 RepID=A0A2G9WYA0_9HYPH|nr:sulfite exporter TauE/SafE family protein [Pleomorphomonas carboxyditropha]PIO99688.1 permease [Pleomorphomonas carboxyditropha]SCM77214.1 Permease protein [uncultured Pleomorphomonas sp.]
MDLYLPIAEMPMNLFLLLGMGAAVGFLSGMFGVGGGFLLTPLLIFSGISPAVAVASVSSQIVANSASGVLAYLRKKTVDLKLGLYLTLSGIIGSAIGVWVYGALRGVGQLDVVIALCYVAFLGTIGVLMAVEAVRAIIAKQRGTPLPVRRPGQHSWIAGLPLRIRFHRSRLYISALPVIALGAAIGFLGALLGIGGGFIMVPALIYLLRVPTTIVIGTTLLQTLGTMAFTTFMQSATNQTVDVILGLALMVGGVVGAQFGARVGQSLRGETLRLLLGLLVLSVGLRFAVDLVVKPEELYSISRIGGG